MKMFKTYEAAAERDTSALQGLPLGATTVDAMTATAKRSVAALESAAQAELIPKFVLATADAVATLDFNTMGQRSNFDATMIELHAFAVANDHLPLAEMIRSASMLERVQAALMSPGVPAEAIADRLRKFVRGLAANVPTHPAADVLVNTVPAFEGRIAAAVERQRAYADEQARIADEAAQQEKAARRSARLAGEKALREKFGQYSMAQFNYSSGSSDWSTVATVLNGAQYAVRVLAPEAETGHATDWRVRQAIHAIRTVDPTYNADWFQPEAEPKAAA